MDKKNNVENGNWIVTDDDSFQCRRRITALETDKNQVYELYQIQAVTDDGNPKVYKIAHDIVFVSEIDAADVCASYGYDGYGLPDVSGIDQIKHEYGDDWQAILAECQFELDAGAMENIMEHIPFMTWNEAKDTIVSLTGIESNLNAGKLCKK